MCERSESAGEWRIALYKSDHHHHHYCGPSHVCICDGDCVEPLTLFVIFADKQCETMQ